jgi:membrane-associated phospholipid phosphatase
MDRSLSPSDIGGVRRLLRDLAAVDQAVYDAVARQETPSLDRPLRELSNLANRSLLWMAIAAVLASLGGPGGRRAARNGLTALAVTSALTNIILKLAVRRPRPEREDQSDQSVAVRMPRSHSFPSGHSASAFAFATAAGKELPIAAVPLEALAAAVAYSRVHSGVHYPSDVIVGSLIGALTGRQVGRIVQSTLG